MADDTKATACARRVQQLKRWADSDTNRESIGARDRPKKVNFQDGCVFLAACSSGDKEEVIKLLARGAEINTANVDGLTALHQACIDDKLDMVKFLVENGADVDVCDNEGWTPLHATASCGFTEIAQYLISTHANIAAVNNDGDLPIDICEDQRMERLLQDEMNCQGVDAEAARREEEDMMLSDANQWLNSNSGVTERPHAKTGAVALHVAAAKGYIKVMHLLIQAKTNVNIKDSDGWTPLHAAAHWSQEKACKILADNFCDMDSKNNAGQTAFDVADTELLSLLEELKKKQAMLRDKTPVHKDIIVAKGIHPKRRTSVTRMSVDQKHNVVLQTLEQERAQRDNYRKDEEAKKSSSSSTNDDSSSESETERQNEINKNTSIPHKMEDNAALASDTTNSQNEFLYDDVFEDPVSEAHPDNENINDNVTFTLPTDATEVQFDEIDVLSSPSGTQPSLASTPSVIGFQSHTSTVQSEKSELRKFGNTSMVSNETSEYDADDIPSSASTSRLACDDGSIKPNSRKTPSSVSTGNVSAEFTVSAPSPPSTVDRSSSRSSSYSRSPSPYSSFTRYYVPYYHRLEEKRAEKQKNSTVATTAIITTPTSTTAPSIGRSPLATADSSGVKENAESTDTATKVISSLPSPSITVTIASTTPTNAQTITSTTTSSVSITTPTTTTPSSVTTDISRPSSTITKRTFEPPKRDEETETQRKARAKKARESRRSTQGISTEDIAKAKALKQTTGTEEKENKEKEQECDKDSDKNDLAKDRLSSEFSKLTPQDTTVSSEEVNLRGIRTLEERSHSNQAPYRRSRDSDLSTSNTPNIYSIDSYSYGQHNQRNVLLSVPDISNTGNSTSVGLNRTSSFRNRFRNDESEKKKEEETKDPSKDSKAEKEKDSERRESSALKARRAKRERRSTGVITYNLKSEEESNSVSKEENESDDSTSLNSRINSGSSSRCVSTSDIPPSITDRHSRSERPSSYAGLSKSTPSLEIDYKKLYENEKEDSNRLKKELDQNKRELSAMKLELERFRRLHEGSSIESNQQKREKRALERKLSELESTIVQHEKLKAENAKVKEENRALARVISKLSR